MSASSASQVHPPLPTINHGDHDHIPAISYKFTPGGSCALDGIALRGFLLGTATGLSATSCIVFAQNGWFFQLPLFLGVLAVFHFLEFYMTARFNTARAEIDAFLLSSNGSAYNIAHTTAIVESLVEWYFFPRLKVVSWTTLVGVVLITCGQTVRSLAMAHAATNFNHYVATSHTRGHKLVTTGVYGYWRHPSYFGFFWWGLGTQLVLGNPISFLGYSVVLWRFFNRRIIREEGYLVLFFGNDYESYKKVTRTWIPFI